MLRLRADSLVLTFTMSSMSEYEVQRLKNIEYNKSVLLSLGLPKLVSLYFYVYFDVVRVVVYIPYSLFVPCTKIFAYIILFYLTFWIYALVFNSFEDLLQHSLNV